MSARTSKALVLAAKLALSSALVLWLVRRFLGTAGLAAAWQALPLTALPLLLVPQLILRWIYVGQLTTLFGGVGYPVPGRLVFRAQSLSALAALGLPGDFAAGAVAWHFLARSAAGPALAGTLLLVARLVLLTTLLPLAVFGLLASGGAGLPAPLLPLCLGLTLAAAAAGLLLGPSALAPFVRWVPTEEAAQRSRWRGLLRALALAAQQVLALSLPQRLAVVLWALASHGVVLLGFFLALQALEVRVSLASCCLAVGVINVVQALPLAFSGAGVRELSVVALFEKLHGAPPEKTLAATVLLFLASTLVTALLGLVALFMPASAPAAGADSAPPAGKPAPGPE